MSSEVAFQAATRFGMGAKPGELMAAEPDPRGWLQAQLRDFDKAPKPANSKERMMQKLVVYALSSTGAV